MNPVAHRSRLDGRRTVRRSILALSLLAIWGPVRAQEPARTRVILDAAPRAVEYQLGRLTNAELVSVERKPDDPRYRLVYLALLTRKGLGREYFDEALSALQALDKQSSTAVLLEGLAKVPAEDEETAGKLLKALLTQPVEALAAEHSRFTALATTTDVAAATLRAAYCGLLTLEPDSRPVIDRARTRDTHLVELLRAIPYLGPAARGRDGLADALVALVSQPADVSTLAAAMGALAAARPDASTFRAITRAMLQADEATSREAGVRALLLLPRPAWPPDEVEPLVRALLVSLSKAPPEARVEPAGVDAIQLVQALSEALPGAAKASVRRELRRLGVRVIRVQTVPEQMMFDLRWFVVEAGKPVQIILSNPDAMSHNLLVIKPGSLKEVGTMAAAMSITSDPAAKPYVPPSPLVLEATRLLNWAETERLNFVAPSQPGEYPFVCTFPGHWVRMNGVMLVVDSLDAWEAAPTTPVDPLTGKPYTAQRE